MHDINLITTIAFGLTAALIFGLLAKRCGLSPIVGYLVAGMVVGPFTPGFVADVELGKQLAEIGVILLMFGVGLHFHLDDLMAVKGIAIPGALGQSAVATACGLGLAVLAGWTVGGGTVLGIAAAVASTVVLLRVLMDHGLLETTEGRVAVGWLVVEDIITVLVLVLLPAVAAGGTGGGNVWATAGVAVLKLGALGALMAFAGVRFVPWLLLRVAKLKSRELFTLTVLVIAMAVAPCGLHGVWCVDGARGLSGGPGGGAVEAEPSGGGGRAAMRDAFAVLFFVSVGMLFDYRRIWHEPWLMAIVNRRVTALGRGANAAAAARLARATTERVIVVGYGPVGRTVARRAAEFGLEALVIDLNIDTVLALQAEKKRALFGDATNAEILRDAGLAKAPYLVISVPDPAASLAVLTAARELNPRIIALARVRYLSDGGALEQAGADAVCYDEAEAATALGVVLRAHLKAGAS